MSIETIAGIEYSKPTVLLLQETGIGTAEYAARTCYDSFDASENSAVQELDYFSTQPDVSDLVIKPLLNEVNRTPHSDLLDKLAWTHFHHSVLEHANLTYLIKGTSRGVLQEHARHRIQAISVRSTRYTMSSVINAFVASKLTFGNHQKEFFLKECTKLDLFVTSQSYNYIELSCIFDKLNMQYNTLTREGFWDLAVAKSSRPALEKISNKGINSDIAFAALQAGKAKRNIGDSFKHIVTDNWKVDMVVTMNLRALKNYLDLRDSGAAYFGIQWLAQAMKDATPSKYLDLIVKPKKS